MTGKSQPQSFYCILSLCIISVLAQELVLEPASTAVLSDCVVRFNATVPGMWEVMTWHVNGLLVLTVSLSSSNNVTSSSQQFSAQFCSHSDLNCVQFTIYNVTRNQSGPVVCSVLGPYGSKTANLTVQESGTIGIMGGGMTVNQGQQVEFQCLTGGWYPHPTIGWSLNGLTVNSSLYNSSSMEAGGAFNSTSILTFQPVSSTTVECWATVAALAKPKSTSVFLVVVPKPPDWTVLIATVVSIGGFASLILLIYGIIFCYKHRKSKQINYRDEMICRVRSQSQKNDVIASIQEDGKDDGGYESDDHTSPGPEDRSEDHSDSRLEMSSVVNTQPAHQTADDLAFKKHRHITTV